MVFTGKRDKVLKPSLTSGQDFVMVLLAPLLSANPSKDYFNVAMFSMFARVRFLAM